MTAGQLRGAYTIDDLRRKAQRRAPKMVTDLVAGGARERGDARA